MALKFNPTTGSLDIVYDKASEINTNTSSWIEISGSTVQTALNSIDSIIAALPDPITYKGTWNASTNAPTLSNSDTGKTGFLYQVAVAGSVDFGAGSISFDVGDKVVNNGTTWDKWDMTDAVSSVNGFTGAVVLGTDNVSEGVTNLYFTTSRAQAAITGGASTIVTANLTADRALLSNASGKVAASTVTSTELGYVSGVTSAIQTQLADKQTLLQTLSVSGNVTLTANRIHLVNTSAARALTLPAVSNNLTLIVKDSTGQAETNNITITPASGTIDGAGSFIITSNYGSAHLVSDGSSWYVL